MKTALDIPSLNNRQIFACCTSDERILLYSPLANIVIIATDEEVCSLEEGATGNEPNELLSLLSEKEEDIYRVSTPERITELSILINQRCNFSCAYCYSANGRDNKEIEFGQLVRIIDWFVKAERGNELEIIFSGGGDPMLSFGLLRQSIEYALQRATDQCIKLNVSVVTNGSMMSDEQMDFISKFNVSLVVSFDILKNIHNAQRSCYDIVVGTIDKLGERNISFGIRATITPLNVRRQEEMVEELQCRFPYVRSAAFETVLNSDLFPSSQDLEQFYLDFEENLFIAQALGQRYGITIGNTIISNVDCCKERACLGKLVATPYGYLTACSRISSPREDYFNEFVYGFIDSNGIIFDSDKINELLNKNVNHYNECNSCIAKWHCSGGCLLARHSFNKEYFACHCRFMRRMVTHVLLNKME